MKVLLIQLVLFATIANFISSQRCLKAQTSDAIHLAGAMKVGWNIGNTLEAVGAQGENSWGNPSITNQLIVAAKKQGFNTIRLPCSWDQYIEDRSTNKIKTSWLERVKQVVQMCIDNSLYVVLNIHWDGGWLETHCTRADEQAVNLKQNQLWTQIATYLKDFDNHLLFASANEPQATDAETMKALFSYHQTFVNAVRASGGFNNRRVLVIQGPQTNIDLTAKLMPTLPKDTVRNRLMVEIHYYSPFPFVLLGEDVSWSKMSYYWGKDYSITNGDTSRNAYAGESLVDQDFAIMKKNFVDKGIPVIIGEFLAVRRRADKSPGIDLVRHEKSRLAWTKYIVQTAKKNGMIPIYWDAGDPGSALIDRKTYRVVDQKTIDAIVKS